MTAKDFLEKYLEYKTFWCFHHSKNSKPAKIRLKRLNSLLKAFEISKENINPSVNLKYSVTGKSKEWSRAEKLSKLNNLEYFEEGEFLNDREKVDNKQHTPLPYTPVSTEI
ncbi:MAG: hypothetical protein AAF990_16365 [Bacteroidota bacterium]